MTDLSVFKNLKTKGDFEREAEMFRLNKRVLESQARKSAMPDVDKLGEIAFMKAAMGEQLTPQEEAAARFIDAKSGGISFNPADGTVVQKPRISEKIGLPGMRAMGGARAVTYGAGGAANPDFSDVPPISLSDMMGGGEGGRSGPPSRPDMNADVSVSIPDQVREEYEQNFLRALDAARGNPKLTQEIKSKYFKDKSELNESQSKAAGFSDRIIQSEPILSDPDKVSAASSMWERTKASIPLLGNYIVSNDFRSFNQAQRDFINAVLRRESGAVIADSEFANAAQQYFPQPGDDAATLAQKKSNRESTLRGIVTSAGPAYTPIKPVMKPRQSVSGKAAIEETIFNAKKAIRAGKDPAAVRQRLIDAGIDPEKAGL